MSQDSTVATIGFGVEIRASSIPGGGNGLFTARMFRKNDLITEYCGPIVDHKKALKLRRQNRHSHIRVLNSQFMYIDGIKQPQLGQGGASFANDARDTHRNNAVFVCRHDHKLGRDRVYLKASRDLEAGTEVFVGYGRDYWRSCSSKQPPASTRQAQSDDTASEQEDSPQQQQRQRKQPKRLQQQQQQQQPRGPALQELPVQSNSQQSSAAAVQDGAVQALLQQHHWQQQQQALGATRCSPRLKQRHKHNHDQQQQQQQTWAVPAAVAAAAAAAWQGLPAAGLPMDAAAAASQAGAVAEALYTQQQLQQQEVPGMLTSWQIAAALAQGEPGLLSAAAAGPFGFLGGGELTQQPEHAAAAAAPAGAGQPWVPPAVQQEPSGLQHSSQQPQQQDEGAGAPPTAQRVKRRQRNCSSVYSRLGRSSAGAEANPYKKAYAHTRR